MRHSNLVSQNILTAMLAASLLSAARDASSQITRDKLAPEYSACYLAGRLGIAQRASKYANAPVRDCAGNKVGKVQDLFLDLNSGGVLCAMLSTGGAGVSVIVPAKSFHSVEASGALLEGQTPGMSVAPHCSSSADAAAILNLLPDSRTYFGQTGAITATAGAAQCSKASELIGLHVKNPDNEQLGTVTDLITDVPTGRILFAVISFTGRDTDLYAVPPTALRLTSDRTALVLNSGKNTITGLAQSDSFFWANLTDANAALSIYRAFGQKPDFDTAADSDPGREQVRTKVESAPSVNPAPVKNDSDIQRDILMAAMRDDVNNAVALQKVKIGCVNGHVTLTGRVRNEKFRTKLNTIVASVVGPANVTDELMVK